MKEFVNQCDVVNFTGKYDNVIELIEDLPKNVSVISPILSDWFTGNDTKYTKSIP